MEDFKFVKGFLNMKRGVALTLTACLVGTSMGSVSAAEANGDNNAKTFIYDFEDQTEDQLEDQTEDQEDEIEVEDIYLNSTYKVINKGTQFTLSPTISPSNATDKTIEWISSDEDVATVDNGVVTGVGSGEAEITAIALSGADVEATCVVKVKSPATSIKLNKSEISIYKKKTIVLKATMSPSDTTDKVTWTTSNKKVATVHKNGQVKGVGKGTATITATTTSGLKATCEVTVKTVSAKSVKLNKKSVKIKAGKTAKLKAIVKPYNSTDDVIWSSSDEEIATVSAKGVVNGVGVGTATITVTVGEKTATCKVTVKAVKSTSLKLNKTKAKIKVGQKLKLKGKLKPSNSTDKITWISSDKEVATVSSKGVVKAVGKGTTVITAETSSGKTATCKVTVKNK